MVNYVCVKTVPDSTKLRLIKGPKSKFPREASPQTPYFATCFTHGYILAPLIIHIISFYPPPPTLGQKAERNLTNFTEGIKTSYIAGPEAIASQFYHRWLSWAVNLLPEAKNRGVYLAQLCKIYAKKCYIESLPQVSKDKRSCFSHSERFTVQLSFDCMLALRK